MEQTVVITFQLQIVITGFYPLRDQRKLERKMTAGELGEIETLDDILKGDAATLLLFRDFMRLEFCEELLEFYRALNVNNPVPVVPTSFICQRQLND